MDVIQAVILGLLQGLTEFLPISSSGHLLIVPRLFGWTDPGSGFTAVIQIGTLVAVLIYFWKDLVSIAKIWGGSLFKPHLRSERDAKLGWGIFFGTIPVAVTGLLFEKQIDTVLRSSYVVAATLASFGLLLGFADWKGKHERKIDDFTVKDGILMGLWQCLALIPGSSRSGSTITGGLFAKFDRATAARVSFLLSVPSVAASGLYKLVKEREVLLGAGLMPTVIATAVAFVSGYWAISFLMKFLQSKNTTIFVIYRVALAVILLVLVFAGRIPVDPYVVPITP